MPATGLAHLPLTLVTQPYRLAQRRHLACLQLRTATAARRARSWASRWRARSSRCEAGAVGCAWGGRLGGWGKGRGSVDSRGAGAVGQQTDV